MKWHMAITLCMALYMVVANEVVHISARYLYIYIYMAMCIVMANEVVHISARHL